MTTIAYRSGTLAADTLVAYSHITNGQRDKIARCGDYVVCLAGSAWLRRPLEEWAEQGCRHEDVPAILLENESNFNALIIDKDGNPFEFDCGYLTPIYADYYAIGSGAVLAIGAMAHGASAEEAVIASSLHDKNTGGTVTTVTFPLEL